MRNGLWGARVIREVHSVVLAMIHASVRKADLPQLVSQRGRG